MNRKEVETFIRLGFEPPKYFKRSVWVKDERIMEYLANKGMVESTPQSERKYQPLGYSIEQLAEAYLKSPLREHLNEMKELSKQTGLPLNSKELLSNFLKLK